MTRGSVLILAGGTGGHVYPALAVAEVLREQQCALYWLGTRSGLEADVARRAGIPFFVVPIKGLRRAGMLRWLSAPLLLIWATLRALVHVIHLRPDVVLGMGGFVSGPAGIAAWFCRRPLIIHEQNAVAGLTNRILARFATRALAGFPRSFPAPITPEIVGNPVRQAISTLDPPDLRGQDPQAFRILVFGGSRGAHALNRIVPGALRMLGSACLNVLHQCGAAEVEKARVLYGRLDGHSTVKVCAFIDDMAAAYADADLVIARAGAITVAEIAACGVAAILIPYPYAVDDHQTANAQFLVEQGAAVLLPESELTAARLFEVVSELHADQEKRLSMARRARALAVPDAARSVARCCQELVR